MYGIYRYIYIYIYINICVFSVMMREGTAAAISVVDDNDVLCCSVVAVYEWYIYIHIHM